MIFGRILCMFTAHRYAKTYIGYNDNGDGTADVRTLRNCIRCPHSFTKTNHVPWVKPAHEPEEDIA